MGVLLQMTWPQWFLAVVLIGICCFLMLVILLQRGRGGGLTGAFGGAGGTSAFGAKTGDVFTWITVVVATVFVVMSVLANYTFDESSPARSAATTEAEPETPSPEPVESGTTPPLPGVLLPGSAPAESPPPGTPVSEETAPPTGEESGGVVQVEDDAASGSQPADEESNTQAPASDTEEQPQSESADSPDAAAGGATTGPGADDDSPAGDQPNP